MLLGLFDEEGICLWRMGSTYITNGSRFRRRSSPRIIIACWGWDSSKPIQTSFKLQTDRQMAHVQTYKNGPHSDLSQKLLNEIAAAKLCLLKPAHRDAYDEQLRQKLSGATGVERSGTPHRVHQRPI